MTPFEEKAVRKIARRSDHKWAHHVAILFQGGEIVSIGYNKGECHAEEMAIRKLQMARGKAQTLRSVRIRRDGRLGASEPCPGCLKLILEAGIRRVYYSDYEGREQQLRLPSL